MINNIRMYKLYKNLYDASYFNCKISIGYGDNFLGYGDPGAFKRFSKMAAEV